MQKALPTDLLRSFLLLAGSGSFTRTGEAIGRTQSAVSMQVRRLESLVGTPLLDRAARGVVLTAKGERLAAYAERILALNDRCLAELAGQRLSGRLRIGIPSDFAASTLPRVLARFAQAYPDVALEVVDDLSGRLVARRDEEGLDLVLALTGGKGDGDPLRVWHEPMVWVGAPERDLAARDPLPLVVHPEGCRYRARMLAALAEAGRAARLVYESGSLAGIEAAVASGLGLSALSRTTAPDALRHGAPDARLPALGQVEIGLYLRRRPSSRAARALADFLSQALDERLPATPRP